MQERTGNGYECYGPDGRGGAVAFVAFTLLHADCGDAVVELGANGSPAACWCMRCDDARVFYLSDVPGDARA